LFQTLIKAEPTILLYQGEFLGEAMRRQRVTREEVLAALRESGAADIDSVAAVILETDGSISVLKSGPSQGPGTLSSLDRLPG